MNEAIAKGAMKREPILKGKFTRVPFDTWLLVLILALAGLGSVIIFSASFARGEIKYGDPFFYFSAHLTNLAVGLAFMLALSQIPYQLWLKISPAIGVAVALMLLAALHPAFARKTLGSARWLKHIPFQPSEAAKLAVVVLLASYFSRVGDLKTRFWYGFMAPCLLIILYGGLIVLERDLGGALVVMGVVVCLMIAAGVRFRHLACFALFGPAVWLLITYYKHRVSRLLGWDDPWAYPAAEGYSVIHSFYAFANGGLTGASIGQSQEKMFFLPMAHTDYIFSILGEELGFIGVAATCLMFLLLAVRGFSIALSTRGGGYHLAVGAVLVVLLPAIINMMVALSIIPAKGLPLPFISYGGSSLVVSMAAMGVLLNISGQALKGAEPPMVVTPYER